MEGRRGARSLGRSLPRTTLIWVGVVVVALVAVDVLLVTLALGRTAPEQHGPAGPIPTYTSTPNPTQTPDPSATGSAGAAGAGGAASRHLIAAVDGKEAWRASGGSCSATRPVLQRTVDGGATWAEVDLGEDVHAVTALRATTGTLSILADVGDDCTQTARTTDDDGVTWAAAERSDLGATISDTAVDLSTGEIDSPCEEPADAYEGRFTTLVACAPEVDWRSGTGPWVSVALPGVKAIADAGETYTLARLGSSMCDGVQVVSLPATQVVSGSQVSPMGCWEDGATDGPVAIALVGKTLWAWAGDEVAVSADGGMTW
ncbi:hypothetical protein BIU98_14910 [Curtobacterium sp. MMLR14_010]|uniref:hypothetical protein n=1 Tax=Curtobacterium sp. MMLR14_010 TaxID=1898743 RepID=UPI0008DDDEF3|nr:hypothetical protein [Curtobacterium sp. MMLR14_010]OII38162.1 hypothetical protein BIU98_14910 [Curtobacterium sp. MMLR14_010]